MENQNSYSKFEREGGEELFAKIGDIIDIRYLDEDEEEMRILLTERATGNLPEEVVDGDERLREVVGVTVESPVGKAVLGRSVGERVSVGLPDKMKAEILVMGVESLGIRL